MQNHREVLHFKTVLLGYRFWGQIPPSPPSFKEDLWYENLTFCQLLINGRLDRKSEFIVEFLNLGFWSRKTSFRAKYVSFWESIQIKIL
jgi:hypothetical protein